MICEVITVGTEILLGAIVNTNGPYLSRLLTEKGYEVKYHTSVKDSSEDIKLAVEAALDRSDIIFFSGGLGPTNDDLTKEAVASALNLSLVESTKTWEEIKSKLSFYSAPITKNNYKQAFYVEGSTIIPNSIGSAPGNFIDYEGKKIFLLPGPPKEFEPMAKYIMNKYLKNNKDKIYIESLNLVFIGESACEDRIRKLNLETQGIEINTFANIHEVEIKIIGKATNGVNEKNIKDNFDKVVEAIAKEFRDNIYAKGPTSLENEVVKKLIEKNQKISFVESITGGLMVHGITSVPDAGQVLEKSFVTYSNRAKSSLLSIDPDIINKYSVVSKEVAREMAKNCYRLTGETYCIATTGEAGPTSFTGKEVGTVCYSIWKDGEEVLLEEVHFRGDRNMIQKRAYKHILSRLLFII